jgi:mono/diheme cytochrome c family protein
MRSLFLSALSLALGAGWYLGTTLGVEGRPPSGRAAQAAPSGAATGQYNRWCARCHGADYSGSGWRDRGRQIPDFRSSSWQNSRGDAHLLVSILDGKGAHMPAFSDRLSEGEARDLVLLIRHASSNRPAGARVERGNFARRYAALQKELEALRRQFRDLDSPPRLPARDRARSEIPLSGRDSK